MRKKIPGGCFLCRHACLLFLLACLFTLGACSAKTGSSPEGASSSFTLSGIFPDETVEEPYLPIDDGLPLSEAELRAFNSTGFLDANLTMEQKQAVELHFKFYVHKNRKTMERFLERSEAYLPYVRHVLKSRGIPEEVAYLAFVESGFNPNAVSRAGAGGMWQFMPFTGKKYGLLQDKWIDERRDPFKATESAAAYLTALHGMFDDWLLALAAYNAGEGKIQRALKGTGASGFFEICDKNDMLEYKAQLREETIQYVPRLLAFAKIMRNLEELGFRSPDPKKALSVAQVDVPPGVDLTAFASATGMKWAEFSTLNPAFRRTISPPQASTRAYVPLAKEEQAVAWLGRKESSLYAGWKDYKVRSGDTMGGLSSRFGISTAMLRQVNGKKSNSLKTGEFLLVPGSTRVAKATIAKLPPELAAKAGTVETSYTKGARHTISKGDTLFALALQWGTSLDAVCEANDIEPNATLRIGQVIYKPVPKAQGSPAASPATMSASAGSSGSRALVSSAMAAEPTARLQGAARASGGVVSVKSGDTLYNIAREHGVSVADLRAWNTMGNSSSLRIGQQLRVTPPSVAVADAGSTKSRARDTQDTRTVTVKSGDTLYSIARANKTTVAVLAKVNKLNVQAPLKPGQTLRLP